MTAKEKAKELIERHTKANANLPYAAIQSALVTVDEIIDELTDIDAHLEEGSFAIRRRFYWEEVKEEIQKL